MTPKVDGSLIMTKHLKYILTVIFAKYEIAQLKSWQHYVTGRSGLVYAVQLVDREVGGVKYWKLREPER